MAQCLRIHCQIEQADLEVVYEFIQKIANKHKIEGLVQPVEGQRIRIVICGEKEGIESFLDELHKGGAKIPELVDFELEPFLKDKDYRGVFRVIR